MMQRISDHPVCPVHGMELEPYRTFQHSARAYRYGMVCPACIDAWAYTVAPSAMRPHPLTMAEYVHRLSVLMRGPSN